MVFSQIVKTWCVQIRAPFLLLSVLLVLIGGAVARYDGVFDAERFFLCLIGVTLAHVSVNLFNELSDHRTGIDHHTRRTPFSGGSGMLQLGRTSPMAVRLMAWSGFLIAFSIGVYLSWVSGWFLMALIILGGLATVFYTTHLAKWVMGELAAGVCLGTFVVLGTYFAQAGTLSFPLIWISVPPGILTTVLLLLNEFPDADADRAGGRKHLVIVLGPKKSALVYVSALISCYLFLAAGMIIGLLPITILLVFFTLPLAVKAALTTLGNHERFEEMIPALGANVGVVLGTDLMIAVAYLLK